METEYRSFMMLYCRTRGVIPASFATKVLLETLYPHARPLLGLIAQLYPDHFRADYEFIEDVSRMQHHTDFGSAVESYISHPANADFLRRRLRLRISVRRMLRLANDIFPQDLPAELRTRLESKNTLTPFDRQGTGEIGGRTEAEDQGAASGAAMD